MSIRNQRAMISAGAAANTFEAHPTGLIDGGEINIGPGANDIEILAGQGLIVDSYANPDQAPTITRLSWPQINTPIAAASTGIAYCFATIEPAPGNPPGPIANTFLGQLKQYPNVLPTPTQVRQEIRLGVVLYNSTTWKDISSPFVVNNTANTLFEFILRVLGPSYVIDGGLATEAATFTINQEAGTIWELNRNWHVDKTNPHRQALPAATGIQWRYINRDNSSIGALTNTVDPSQYDSAGSVIAVPGGSNTATIQRLYLDPGDNYWMMWGQDTLYSNGIDAGSAIPNRMILPEVIRSSWLLAYVVVSKGNANWTTDQSYMVYPETVRE